MSANELVTSELKTIRDYLRLAVSRFHATEIHCGHGTDSLWDEAVYLVFHAASLPFDADQRVFDACLTHEEREHIMALIEMRTIQKIPMPYLTHEAWFCGLPFYVDERVLIPRSPIGELIEKGFQPWIGEQHGFQSWLGEDASVNRILDLCAGSGCIGIACAVAFPNAVVDLADLSTDALEVAQINVDRHDLHEQVRVVESDVFSALKGERYDLIVSNPPYVDADEMDALPDEYRHEPELGLAAGDDGLDIVRRILKEAANHLTDHGLLVVEVGASELALIAAYPNVPFTWVEFENGGQGVFVLTAQQLKENAAEF